jgi:hypothetical protein
MISRPMCEVSRSLVHCFSTAFCLVGSIAAMSAADPPLVSSAVSVDGGVTLDERPRDGGGSFDGDWQLAEARLFLRPHVAVRLGIGIAASRTAYHSDDLEHELPDDVREAWVRVPLAMMFHPHWGMTIQGSFGTGTDGTASASDGQQWQVQGGPIYVRDSDLIIALLVNVSSRIDDSPTIFPFPSLYWHFLSDWRLTVVDDVDNLSHLRWQVREDLDLGLRVDVRLREVAIASDQALSDDHIAVALQATWMPSGRGGIEVTPVVGAQVVRRLAVRDNDGHEQWSLITRPAPLVGLNLRASF